MSERDISDRLRDLRELEWKRPDRHRDGLRFGCPFAKGDIDQPAGSCRCPRFYV